MEYGHTVGIETRQRDFPACCFSLNEFDNFASFCLKAAFFDGSVNRRPRNSEFLGCFRESKVTLRRLHAYQGIKAVTVQQRQI
jgi:hypothetical protein